MPAKATKTQTPRRRRSTPPVRPDTDDRFAEQLDEHVGGLGDAIVVHGARQHNLKDISVSIPRDKLVVLTGLSGSGKSSLAFDTIYAEGQRRYVESLSSYARQFLGQLDKPDVDHIDGLSPAIAIDQKSASNNPRSTVGTITEIHDYLRLLYARIGIPHCPVDGSRLGRQTVADIVDLTFERFAEGTKLMVLAPIVEGRKGTHDQTLSELAGQGYARVRIDGTTYRLDELPDLDAKRKHIIELVVDRFTVKSTARRRLTESVEAALDVGKGVCAVEHDSKDEDADRLVCSQDFACPTCRRSYTELEPRNFSFNSPYGACETCDGLGTTFQADEALIVTDETKTLAQGAISIWAGMSASWMRMVLRSVCDTEDIPMDVPYSKLTKKARKFLMNGSDYEYAVRFESRSGYHSNHNMAWEGALSWVARRHAEAASEHARDQLGEYLREVACQACKGARLAPYPLAARVDNTGINELGEMPVRDAATFFTNLTLNERDATIAVRILKEIRARLSFLVDVGLDYLTLNRSAKTLSGGEAQRIRLASQVGSGLVGVLYVLDEPSIGLHQRDNARLLGTLERLRDLGNTVLVVEHDEDTIRHADHIVDVGPGAGILGGNIVASGSLEDVCAAKESITGGYLSGRIKIDVPDSRREGNGNWIKLRGAREHNLQGVNVDIPLGRLVAVCGVSGSGKSTLVGDILSPAIARTVNRARVRPGRYKTLDGVDEIDKLVNIDQSPIGRTPRSNPATYTGVFDKVRTLFSNLPESKTRGWAPGRFSFNVKGGRCETCTGDGTIKIEMHFLPDVYVPCETCHGARYNRDTLEILFKGKNIADVLAMPVADAAVFFENQPAIARQLQTLVDVGLGYIALGQPATTLSGGEAQRIKLASELQKRATGKTFYVLDEPTTGLHFHDVAALLGVLDRLVDAGNTVLVIEHNLDVIKRADWIIDMGPEGGDAGGTIVVEGTPELIAQTPASHTGRFLAPLLT